MSPGTVGLTLACLVVVAETARVLRNLRRLRRLDRVPVPVPARWPSVSVVIAARDEAADVGHAVRSRLAEDYPALELVLVDDRSTDGTGRLALAEAGGDARLTVTRVEALPKGWLGKLNALHTGVQAAKGDWVLFSDGDVSVAPGTLRRAVAYCEANGLDHLALLPGFEAPGWVMGGVWAVFLRGLLVSVDPVAVRDPSRKAAMGSGGFNLVRRVAFDRTPGFAHLKLETADDVALGVMMKQAGGRTEFIDGSAVAKVPLYRTVGHFLRGIEKNGATTATVPAWAVAVVFLALWALICAPVVALAVGPEPWLRALGAATLTLYTWSEAHMVHRTGGRWAHALLWPLGGVIVGWGMVRATWLARRNGGVSWRGTFYSLEELAEGRRLKL